MILADTTVAVAYERARSPRLLQIIQDQAAGVCGITVAELFAGVRTAVGCLYGRFSTDDLAARLSWIGLDETDESVLRLVQENAIRFFNVPAEQRQQLAAAASHPVEHA